MSSGDEGRPRKQQAFTTDTVTRSAGAHEVVHADAIPWMEARGQIAVVESVKAASDIYAPVKGEVVEANEALSANPALVNTDPFGEGWIFVLKMDSADDVKKLKDAAAYQQTIG